MPDTKKQRLGHARLIRRLVEIGAARQLANDLGEDTRAMVARAVSDKLDELRTTLTRRINDQGERITALEAAVNTQNESIEAQSAKLEVQSAKLGTIEGILKQLRGSLEGSEVRPTEVLEP